MFGIRLLQPIQAIINTSHLGRLGASLIVANLPAGRCGWHICKHGTCLHGYCPFKICLSNQNLYHKGDGPNFSKATFTKKPKIRRLQEPTKKKKTFLASTCRCDLRKTANKLSLRNDPGDTGYPSAGQISWGKLSIETFRQFFPWAVAKLIGATWN